MEQSFCTVYFDIFFNSPKLIKNLFQKGIYGIGTGQANRKQMPKTVDDKHMKRGDCEFLFSSNTMACKWLDNRSVLLLSSALEEMNDILLWITYILWHRTKMNRLIIMGDIYHITKRCENDTHAVQWRVKK